MKKYWHVVPSCYKIYKRDDLELSRTRKLALVMSLLLLAAALLSGCGYWAVEAASVQVGDAVVRVTQVPGLEQ